MNLSTINDFLRRPGAANAHESLTEQRSSDPFNNMNLSELHTCPDNILSRVTDGERAAWKARQSYHSKIKLPALDSDTMALKLRIWRENLEDYE
jgi:hypothetical protein